MRRKEEGRGVGKKEVKKTKGNSKGEEEKVEGEEEE